MGSGTVVSVPDIDERRRIQRARRRFLLLVMGTASVVAAVGAAVFISLGGYESDVWHREPPGWVEVLGMVLVAVGSVFEIGAIVYAIRSGRYRANRDSRLWAVGWSRQRELFRQVRRGGNMAADDLPLLRHAAEQLAGQRWLIVFFGGLLIINLGQAFIQWSPFHAVLLVVLVPLLPVAVASTLRNVRRGEAFLRAHPTPGEDDQDRTVSGR
jgi:hypothetical protein